jgi:hypothetical protein
MSQGGRRRHAKPKRRRGPAVLIALVILIAIAGVALSQKVRWWPTAQPDPVAVRTHAPTPSPTPTPKPVPPPGPTRLASLVGSTLPGEGAWVPVVGTVAAPAVEVAWLRIMDDPKSKVAIAWLNQNLVTFELRPGTSNPGVPGGMTISPWLPPDEQSGLAAAFNGGFRMVDSFGGFYLDGQMLKPLWTGAASAVIYKDGHLNVGTWGHDIGMTSQVYSVRQELVPLLDNGVPGPNLTTKVVQQWGGIVGSSVHVWRSAIGITATGAVLYVCGPALAPSQLVQVLQRAGAVRAMELDINPNWVTFTWFSNPTSLAPVAHKLIDFDQSARRYTSGPSARDFFAVYLR